MVLCHFSGVSKVSYGPGLAGRGHLTMDFFFFSNFGYSNNNNNINNNNRGLIEVFEGFGSFTYFKLVDNVTKAQQKLTTY